jgi:DNA primase
MDDAEIVKSKVDIVEVISSYVLLKKAGRNLSGLCPFHSEKTPSFMVSPDRQVFKCFGCSEGGDVFTFLEKIEGWTFPEVLEELAKRVGVKLKTFVGSEQGKQKDKLLAINATAAKFYSYLLGKHRLGEKAREYLEKRGVKEETWKKFDVGYAPAGWDNTLNALLKRGFGASDISAAGLVIARSSRSYGGQVRREDGDGFYDRFRDRLMFPLKDQRGVIVGFSGRTISAETRQEPKYINSPETPIFNKGSLLFGLDLAKEAIRSSNEAVLVEGEFDVMSSNQAGITNIVATKGTAFGEKQVGLISRICENVAICFDGDLAGDKASRRSIEMLDAVGLTVKVVALLKYKDPDEFSQQDPEGFKKTIKRAANVYDYFIESASSRFDVKSADGKKKVGRELIPIISKISDDMVRAHYIAKLAQVLDLDINLVSEAISKKQINISAASQINAAETLDKGEIEKYFLALFLTGDEIEKQLLKVLDSDDFLDQTCRELWSWLRDIMRNSRTLTVRKVLESLPIRHKLFVDNLYLIDVGREFLDKDVRSGELGKIAKRIKEKSLKTKLEILSEKIGEAEKSGDNQKVELLSGQFNEISMRLKKE